MTLRTCKNISSIVYQNTICLRHVVSEKGYTKSYYHHPGKFKDIEFKWSLFDFYKK